MAYPSAPGSASTTTAAPAGAYPQQVYPQATPGASPSNPYATPGAYAANGAYPAAAPTAQANAAYPSASAYPGAAAGTGYGAQGYAPVQVYDAHTGQVTSAAGTPYQMVASRGVETTLYAGIAYEVHAVGSNGATTAVNPANHVFHTGDRFVVYYRPSMPGKMDVYNINPSGQRTRIDAVTMAAGQLASLGPYEFSAQKGDESLRLVLAPCTSPQLLVATRDIVNVGPNAGASAAPAVNLGACDGPNSRDVTSRDITKVAVDDGTAFALDPVSQKELSAGQVIPREVNIVFHHR